MKTNYLSKIMKDAWSFFHITGVDFAECLCISWANFKLVQKMRCQIVKFYFIKVDGTRREAYGTLSEKIVPKTEQANDRKKNDTTQTYYDTEVQNWRCYKKMNLIF